MFEDLLIPLLLTEILGELKGKTRFQKLIYLIQEEAAARNVRGLSFTYDLYHYGPFSSDFSSVLENLRNRGLLDEVVETTPAGYERFIYSMTDEGRTLLENSMRKKLLPKKLERIVREVAEEYGEMQLSELVEEAYRRFSS